MTDLNILISGNRFALDADQTSCFEFPETNGDCDSNGCDYKKGAKLCQGLDGFPTVSSLAMKNEKMVRKLIDLFVYDV